MAKTWHAWQHGTVQSLAVIRLWIVHDNCDFTERSLVYWGLYNFSHFTHTSTNISHFPVKKRQFLNAVCYICYIDSCIYSPTLQAIFDHMKPNSDP